jgi:hypothetical protein
MESSRVARKQKSSQALYKKVAFITVALIGAGVLLLTWYLNYKLTFTVLTVIIFFGVLCVKPDLLKKYMPGLNSANQGIRIIASILYLLAVMALISQVGLATA